MTGKARSQQLSQQVRGGGFQVDEVVAGWTEIHQIADRRRNLGAIGTSNSVAGGPFAFAVTGEQLGVFKEGGVAVALSQRNPEQTLPLILRQPHSQPGISTIQKRTQLCFSPIVQLKRSHTSDMGAKYAVLPCTSHTDRHPPSCRAPCCRSPAIKAAPAGGVCSTDPEQHGSWLSHRCILVSRLRVHQLRGNPMKPSLGTWR
mmetsp:Transcript_29063/g.66115  ORF Transcript_29063/g.66115 Transcript_29063/m.66115 type:complete len:202 (-) Transcript_29063:22-627(-)